jgi:hypothetical protein
MLRWDQAQLALAAEISVETIKRIERLDGDLASTKAGTLQAIQRALEAAGVVFLSSGALLDGGPGVRLQITANTSEELTDKIDAIEGQLARPEPALEPSPEAGMRQLERARKQNAVTKLKNRRTKLTKDK